MPTIIGTPLPLHVMCKTEREGYVMGVKWHWAIHNQSYCFVITVSRSLGSGSLMFIVFLLQFSMSASPRPSWAWTCCARPSLAWGRQLCLFWLPYNSWSQSLDRYNHIPHCRPGHRFGLFCDALIVSLQVYIHS